MSDGKKVVQDHFTDAAENYAKNSAIHAFGEDLQWLVAAHSLTGEEVVLDVGTGAGHAGFAFAPHVAQVEGVDITPLMLEHAQAGADERGFTNMVFTEADVEDLPHEDAQFDMVVSRWNAHHYLNVRLAMAEIVRVLKPKGVFLLIDSIAPTRPRHDTFFNTIEMLRDTGHVRNYSLSEWLDYLERVGLHGTVEREWLVRIDGNEWVNRMNTPEHYVIALRNLLYEADDDLREGFNITDGDEEWGFDLPAALIKARKID